MRTFHEGLVARGAVASAQDGAVYVERASWDAAVDVARDLGLVITGIEGFTQNNGSLESMLDYIADFSEFGSEDGPASWEASRKVLRAWMAEGGPEVVEFVLDCDGGPG